MPSTSRPRRILKALASIKLAVVVILALGTMTAWGTFVEAKYNDAEAAAKIVYNSPLMYIIMGIFAVNLISVMVDRLPWRERHTGFILAHIGLLLLMVGAVMTKTLGVDGSMSIGLGQTSKQVIIGAHTDLTLYSSMDAMSYMKIDDHEVDFFSDRPSKEKPFPVLMPQGSLKVINYFPYSIRDQKIADAQDSKAGAALRFQIQNANVSVTEWLLQPAQGRAAVKDLGPAQIVLGPAMQIDPSKNTIVLIPGEDSIAYEIHTARDPKTVKKGSVKAGDTIETGWMGLVFRTLKYIPHAKEQITFKEMPASTPLTQASVLIEFQRDAQTPPTQHWLAINSMLKLFTDQAVYLLTFANRRINLDFNLKLKDFKVGRYPGVMKAASYESLVDVLPVTTAAGPKDPASAGKPAPEVAALATTGGPTIVDLTISMNEPLKHGGFTIYQSSFSEDEQGRPTESIFSVNKDPGRWVKYLGCLLIVFGSIHLFYFKRKSRVKASPAAAFPVAP